ncbi:non-ribosomal peptide synthetase domain protein [Mycobacterium ulcerans str. Harvey]|uniref:Non-ribosomal peptide synthetase domain protein n=1 Tax=Mycobacterium ulcerans str. Harvey TaxID=1299332 RepID=A0ABP3AEK0_MYCUL|nr:non-ribosomal peptide synthetase domain protein [Mycobacterium ulcerans str. Harvey]
MMIFGAALLGPECRHGLIASAPANENTRVALSESEVASESGCHSALKAWAKERDEIFRSIALNMNYPRNACCDDEEYNRNIERFCIANL